jgi:hypothetical protein
MNNTWSVTIRANPVLRVRIDSLIPKLQADPRSSGFARVGRSTVLRLALERGAAQLEQQLIGAPKERVTAADVEV